MPRELDTYDTQAAAAAGWLAPLLAAHLEDPTVLPGWSLRSLVGHLVGSRDGLAHHLTTRSPDRATPAATYVRAFAAAAEQITESSAAVADGLDPDELLARLGAPVPRPDGTDTTVLAGPRGPITAGDFVRLRLLDLVVHCDDLSRSFPDRDPLPLDRRALATTVRTLAELLAAQAPGRSVEVRVPPFVAVQAVAGPRHTRGTPSNVVETDPLTWLRIATGRVAFGAAVAEGTIRASGNRADLAPYLPVLA